MVSDSGRLRMLSTWNQVAMRGYVRQVFCFPIDEQLDNFDELCTHIQDGLSLACSRFPHFAGKIYIEPTNGKGYVRTTANDVLSFKFFDNRRRGEPLSSWSYPELKAQGFPCKAFVGPSFDLPYVLTEDGPEVPVAEVHARVIRGGGLLLCFYIHHSVTDGIGIFNFISTFAAFTLTDETGVESGDERGVVEKSAKNGLANGVANVNAKLGYPANIDVDIPDNETAALLESRSFEELLDKCPEYTLLPQPTGPTAPCTRREWMPSLGHVPKTGRIFKFSPEKIDALRAMAQTWTESNSRARAFSCLAAVTWSCCTAARLAGHQSKDLTTDESHLLVPASWLQRTYQGELSGYASNAVCMPRICTSMDTHVAISGGQPSRAATTASPATTTTTMASGATKDEQLGKLICSIDAAITAIDRKFVATRTAMFRAAPDPRFVGVNLDPQDPRDFIFNSWRVMGADIVFWFPGLKAEGKSGSRGRTADAVRRAQPQWNMGAGLVLQGKRGSDYEVLVTLDEASMRRLLANEEWKKWVGTDKTIE